MTPPLSPDPKVDPHLPAELVELILVIALRLTAVTSHWDLPTTGRLLCVLPRDLVPSPTKTLFVHFPWIDVGHVSRFDCASTLQFLLNWSNKPGGRPIRDLKSVSPSVIDRATACGSIASLNWWFYESGLPIGEWSADGVDEASGAGHVHMLRWWFASGKELKVTVVATRKAARNGHLAVLEFWLQHKGETLFNEAVIQAAVEAGRLDILQWWQSVGLALNLASVLSTALRHSQLDILVWIVAHPTFSRTLEGKPDQTTTCLVSALSAPAIHAPLLAFYTQAAGGKLTEDGAPEPARGILVDLWTKVLREGDLVKVMWLHRLWPHPLGKSSEHVLIERACASGNIQLLDWIRATFTQGTKSAQHAADLDPFDIATEYGHVHVLDWLVANGFQLQVRIRRVASSRTSVRNYFTIASGNGRIDVLEWWVKFPKFTNRPIKEAMKSATQKGQLAVLDWWRDKSGYFHSHLDFSGMNDLFTVAISGLGAKAFDVLDWWLNKSQLRQAYLPKPASALVAASQHGLVSVLQLVWESQTDSMSSGGALDVAKEGLLAASRKAQIGCMDWWLTKSGAFQQPALPAALELFEKSGARHHPNALPWWECVLGASANRDARNVVSDLQSCKELVTPVHWMMLARMGVRIVNSTATLRPYFVSGDIGMLAYMYHQYGQELKLDVSSLCTTHDSRVLDVLDWLRSRTDMPIVQMVRDCPRKSVAVRRWLIKCGESGTVAVNNNNNNSSILDLSDDDDGYTLY